MKVMPIARELNAEMLSGIGRVCFEWAILERSLATISYTLLNLGPKHGRVAVRSPRADEQITMIRQLMSLEQVSVPSFDLEEFIKPLTDLKNLRDVIAHGVWLRPPGEDRVIVQYLSGNWRPDPKGPKISRRITPEGIPVSAEDLIDLADTIKSYTSGIEHFGSVLKAELHALREKRQQKTGPDHPPEDQIATTP